MQKNIPSKFPFQTEHRNCLISNTPGTSVDFFVLLRVFNFLWTERDVLNSMKSSLLAEWTNQELLTQIESLLDLHKNYHTNSHYFQGIQR